VGALAHYFEEERLSTTQISLVREHTEAIRPPRALWVPFELDRPLGQPNDSEFQMRVLRACLGLLDADSGPVLEDYPEGIPSDAVNEEIVGLSCPIDLPSVPLSDSDLAQSLLQEIGQVAPWYDLAVNQRQRTTVGISELDIVDAARFLADFIENPSSSSPRPEVDTGQMLKFACEDLKVFYSEAMSAQPGMSSSLAVENWLWNETVLGKLFWKFREENVDHPDPYTRYLTQRGLIPDRQIQFKGAPVFE
jgi:hypothetical protein